MLPSSLPPLKIIAAEAGVSLSTVDRVIHNRPNTSLTATKLVKEAIARLNDSRASDVLDLAIDIILPRNAGASTIRLAEAFRTRGEVLTQKTRVTFVERLNPESLAAALMECQTNETAGVAFQAIDHPLVRRAVGHLLDSGIKVIAIVSDLPRAGLPYIGLDNRAAGRTAGHFMKLLNGTRGPMTIIWGGHLDRGHEEREFGFLSYMRREVPEVEIFDVQCEHDSDEEVYRRLSRALKEEPKLSGVYVVGGGISGAVSALLEGRSGTRPSLIVHNLTEDTSRFLLDGIVDVVIHQSMTGIARKTIDCLINGPAGETRISQVRIEVIVKENISDMF